MSNDKKLPTTIGEGQVRPDGVALHSPEASRFDPVAYYAFPATVSAEAVASAGPGTAIPVAPHEFKRQHPPIFLGELPIPPVEYVVHIHSSECQHCKSLHRWSVVYAHNKLRNRSGSGFIDNLSPIQAFSYDLPFKLVELRTVQTPVCFECAPTVSLEGLPLPPPPDRIVGTIGRAADTSTPDKPGKKPKTIDDLLGDL